MEIKKILWPTDLSNNAAQALPYVTSLTKKYQAETHLLYVMESLKSYDFWHENLYCSFIEQEDYEREEKSAKARLDEISTRCLSGSPACIQHFTAGDPAHEILKFIKKENIGMVVMTNHGEKGDCRFRRVCEVVAKNSPVPIVIIPISSENVSGVDNSEGVVGTSHTLGR